MPGQVEPVGASGQRGTECNQEFSWSRTVAANSGAGAALQEATLPDLKAANSDVGASDPDVDVKKTKLQIKIDRLRKTAQLLSSADLVKLGEELDLSRKNAKCWEPGEVSAAAAVLSCLVGTIGTISSIAHSTSFLMAAKYVALSLSAPALVIGGIILVVAISAKFAEEEAVDERLEKTDEDLAKAYQTWKEIRDSAQSDAQIQNYTHAEEERLFKSMLLAKSKALENEARKLELQQKGRSGASAISGQPAKSAD